MSDNLTLASLRQDLVTVSARVFERGLTSATSGNPSARVPGRPEQVLIKRTGKSFGDVRPEDFLLVDLDGNVLEGEGKPSKELFFHLAVYRRRPEVGAVLHGHSPYATAYVTAKGELPIVTAAAEAGLTRIPVVGYAPPGSMDLARMVEATFSDPQAKAAVLLRHGFVTVGSDIYNSFYLADVLEDNAKVAFLLAQLGR